MRLDVVGVDDGYVLHSLHPGLVGISGKRVRCAVVLLQRPIDRNAMVFRHPGDSFLEELLPLVAVHSDGGDEIADLVLAERAVWIVDGNERPLIFGGIPSAAYRWLDDLEGCHDQKHLCGIERIDGKKVFIDVGGEVPDERGGAIGEEHRNLGDLRHQWDVFPVDDVSDDFPVDGPRLSVRPIFQP